MPPTIASLGLAFCGLYMNIPNVVYFTLIVTSDMDCTACRFSPFRSRSVLVTAFFFFKPEITHLVLQQPSVIGKKNC